MKHLLAFIMVLPAFGAEFLEINNATTNIVRRVRDRADDWTAPAHKFGPDKPTRFVKVIDTARPTNVDEAIYELTPVVTINSTEAIRSWTTNRLTTNQIVRNIRLEAQRRVNLIVSGEDAITLLGSVSEVYDKQLSVNPVKPQADLNATDKKTLTDARALWDRAKAIRVRARELIQQADTVTALGGWPE